MDRLFGLGVPGLLFLALVVWLVRKVIRAARTEGDLEAERLTGALAQELQAAKARAAAASSATRGGFPSGVPASGAFPGSSPSGAFPGSPRRPDDEVARLVASAVELVEPIGPLHGADTRGASPKHLTLIEQIVAEREALLRAGHPGETEVARRVEVLWARSTATHMVWCERRNPATRAAAALAKDVICVALLDSAGRVADRWSY